jgi:hypothetical protein
VEKGADYFGKATFGPTEPSFLASLSGSNLAPAAMLASHATAGPPNNLRAVATEKIRRQGVGALCPHESTLVGVLDLMITAPSHGPGYSSAVTPFYMLDSITASGLQQRRIRLAPFATPA